MSVFPEISRAIKKEHAMHVYVIDDENSEYVKNIVDLFSTMGHSVNHIDNIDDARSSINDMVRGSIVIVDLMLPETDSDRLQPEDSCEVGAGLCRDLAKRMSSGVLAAITNAKEERHAGVFSALRKHLGESSVSTRIIFKQKTGSVRAVDSLLDMHEISAEGA